MYQYFLSFYCQIFHCMHILHCTYPFISWRICGVLLLFAYCELLLWTSAYKFFCRCIFPFILGIYVEVELTICCILLFPVFLIITPAIVFSFTNDTEMHKDRKRMTQRGCTCSGVLSEVLKGVAESSDLRVETMASRWLVLNILQRGSFQEKKV